MVLYSEHGQLKILEYKNITKYTPRMIKLQPPKRCQIKLYTCNQEQGKYISTASPCVSAFVLVYSCDPAVLPAEIQTTQ